MVTNAEVNALLPLRGPQIGVHTDLMLVRDRGTGACSQASCLYISFCGVEYAVSCHHALRADADYLAGAKRLAVPRIEEGDNHAVRPFELLASSPKLDLAVFELSGLNLERLPASAYNLDENTITFERAAQNKNTLSFIYATAGFGTKGTQYSDGLVWMNAPIYAAHGPIVSITEEVVVGDFAEKELIELNAEHYPQIADVKPTGGTRHLGGMSGSGLWVYADARMHLAGILLGPHEDNDPKDQHLIRFAPVWRLKEWLAETVPTKNPAPDPQT